MLYSTPGNGELLEHGSYAVADIKIARLNEAKRWRIKAADCSSGPPSWAIKVTRTNICQSQNPAILVVQSRHLRDRK